MALLRLGATHAPRAELDRQPVDQPRQLTLSGGLLDQAFLCGAQLLGPVCGERESVEAELGVQLPCLVGEKPLQMLRLAAGDRGRDRSDSDAAVDAIAGQR